MQSIDHGKVVVVLNCRPLRFAPAQTAGWHGEAREKAWDDGELVPEGLVMADVERALTCAFMTQSSKPAEARAVRSASFA